jgi:hypothetical protein
MAIDRIPGVGPQNTDIATAVAAAVPTIAAITSSITTNAASAGLTNASITSAGNAAGWGATGPTTTQIAAAVPTLAQITTAITTNAASAGVTNASIASTVAANAGGQFSGTWTNLAFVNFGATPSTAGLNVSGLTGYKYLRLITTAYAGVATTWRLRFNGATTNYYGMSLRGARGTNTIRESRFSITTGIFMGDSWIENQPPTIDLMIENSNSSTRKIVKATDFSYLNGASQVFTGSGFAVWDDNSQISSLQLDAFGANVTGGFAVLWGGN